jgi:hypothetical protein
MCVCMRLPAYVLHVMSMSRCGPAALPSSGASGRPRPAPSASAQLALFEQSGDLGAPHP